MSMLKAKEPGIAAPGKTKGMVYGRAGVGKTWFMLSFPKPYYIDTEGGADLRHYQERLKASGGVYLGPNDGANDFQTILDQVKALATENHPYQTLVIDSITKVFQTRTATESDKLGDKDGFGASKKPAIKEMRKLINWIQRIDMNVWFGAHEISEWGIGPSGQKEEIGKIPDAWDKVAYELQLCLQIMKRGKIYPPMARIHKTRLLGFPDGETFPLEYSEFATRYGKDYIEAERKAIVLAKPEQVEEIKRLVDLLKITEEETEKMLTKAKADSWTELSEDQAEKALKTFKAKLEPKTKGDAK